MQLAQQLGVRKCEADPIHAKQRARNRDRRAAALAHEHHQE